MRLYTFGKYLKEKFNKRVYKVPISVPGFTCPNIDGTTARGGCVFCENESFSPNLKEKEKIKLNLNSKTNPLLDKQLKSLERQFFQTLPFLKQRFKAKKFIVYFQSWTNTYAPFTTLKALYEKALSFDDVVGISIGTRTDSITDETLDYLKYLSTKTEVWVEYGIQTSNDETLKRINRGHNFENVQTTIAKTKKLDLNVCGHIIYGLPNETEKEWKQTFNDTIKLNIDSIKFHPMYVTKNPILAKEYEEGKFTPITEKEYIDILMWSLENLPENISIQRMTAGVDNLIAPKWCKNKGYQIKKIMEEIKKRGKS